MLESPTELTTYISCDQELSAIKKEIRTMGIYDNQRQDFYSRNFGVTSGKLQKDGAIKDGATKELDP